MDPKIRFIVAGDKFAKETFHAFIYSIYYVAQQYAQNALL